MLLPPARTYRSTVLAEVADKEKVAEVADTQKVAEVANRQTLRMCISTLQMSVQSRHRRSHLFLQ